MRTSIPTALLALAALTSAATTPPADTISLAGIDMPILNATSPRAIDPRFTVTRQYQLPDLDVDQCLLNVIDCLATYAVLNFTDSTEVLPHVNPRYPGVTIVPRATTAGGRIESRFLVWGLYTGIRGMVFHDIYQTVEFTLKRDNEVVGYIKIMKPETQSSLPVSNSTNGLTLPPGGELSLRSRPISRNDEYLVNTSDTPDNPDFHHLSVDFTGFGQPLQKNDIYMAILKTLVYIAPFDRNQRLQNFGVAAPAPFDATLRIVQYRPPPPASAQTFSYIWAARSLVAVPQILMQLGRWTEASFEVVVDGVPVGKGAIVKGRM